MQPHLAVPPGPSEGRAGLSGNVAISGPGAGLFGCAEDFPVCAIGSGAYLARGQSSFDEFSGGVHGWYGHRVHLIQVPKKVFPNHLLHAPVLCPFPDVFRQSGAVGSPQGDLEQLGDP